MAPLCKVINQSIVHGYAEITPLFKKASRLDSDNYRPVSLLPVFSKVFLKVVNNLLLSFFFKKMENNNSQK